MEVSGAVIPGEVGAAAVIKPALSRAETVWHPLQQLWSEAVSPGVPRVRWWIGKNRLHWEMDTARLLADRTSFPAAGFVEGLWEQDVAEFFLLDRRRGSYQEFNLSPGGAWWSAVFSAPRARTVPQPDWTTFAVQTDVNWTAQHWTGRLSLPLPDLADVAVNFTAITAGPERRRFFSLASLGGTTPDFHRPGEWIAVSAGKV